MARAPARRYHSGPAGQPGVRSGRDHPPHLGSVLSRRRPDREKGPGGNPRRPRHGSDDPGDSWLQLLLALGQHRRRPPPHPAHPSPRNQRLGPTARNHCECSGARLRGRLFTVQHRRFPERGADQSRPDRPPNGNPPPQHDAPRNRHRRSDGAARTAGADAGGTPGDRGPHQPGRAGAVADQPAAQDAAGRAGRGHQRSWLFQVHLLR